MFKTCQGAWFDATQKLVNAPIVTSRDLKNGEIVTTSTKELLSYQFQVSDPRQRLIWSRPVSVPFMMVEVLWIMSGRNDLEFLEFWNPRIKTWSEEGHFYGAYGARLGNQFLYLDYSNQSGLKNRRKASEMDDSMPHGYTAQLYDAFQTFLNIPHSRQVVLNIYDYLTDAPENFGQPRSNDVPCNIVAMPKVRDGKLYWTQIMRSNDLIWGTPYNIFRS